jgi:hypothetical protein
MGSRTCPKCGLISPLSASRCDCGYNFETGAVGAPLVVPEYAPGISGWLAFFSIGVWVTPLMLSYYLIQSWIESSREVEKSVGRPLDFSMVYLLLRQVPHNRDAALFFAVFGGSLALIGVSIWLLTQWWQRKRQFPRNWAILQMVFVVIMVITVVNDPKEVQPRNAVSALAHVLFWLKSKRVAVTFTQ